MPRAVLGPTAYPAPAARWPRALALPGLTEASIWADDPPPIAQLLVRFGPDGDPDAQLLALARRGETIRRLLPDTRFHGILAQLPAAPGEALVDRLADLLEKTACTALDTLHVGICCGASAITPAVADRIRRRGIRHVRLRVGSFVDREAATLGLSQREMTVQIALEALRTAAIPHLQLDLVYGVPGQEPHDWQYSLEAALEWYPGTIALHPHYPAGPGPDRRPTLYEQGRRFLLACGYEQHTARRFCGPHGAEPLHEPEYRVGLGPGAWSHHRRMRWTGGEATAIRGAPLTPRIHRSRALVVEMLHRDGVDRQHFRRRFGSDPTDLPVVAPLIRAGLLVERPTSIGPTPLGWAWHDAIVRALVGWT